MSICPAPGESALAIAYARSAWCVLPCTKKRPLVAHGFLDATTDEARIREWWTRWPDAQVAIRTGTASGLAVLDIDPRNGGDESFTELVVKRGALPETKEVASGGGGRHLYFTLGRALASRVVAPGIELKADGGYVIAPPSLHESGRRYEWLIESPNVPLAPLPGWLYAGPPKAASAPVAEFIAEGDRHRTLVSLAGSMRRRGCLAPEILAALAEVNRLRCLPPMPDGEVRSIAESVAKYAVPADDDGRDCPRHASVGFSPRPIPLSELLTIRFPPLDWLISRVLVQGAVGWIGGAPKLGKSMVGLHAALSVATGTPFLGEFSTKQGRALYVSEEDPPRITFRRVQRMLAGTETEMLDGDAFRAMSKAGFKLDRADHLEWLRGELARYKPKLVVFDVFNRLHQGEVNKAEDMLPIMQALDRLRTECGCCILTVIHFKKPQQDGQEHGSPGSMIAGSLALHAFSECSIYIRKVKEKVRLTFEAKEFEAMKDVNLTLESDEGEDSRIELGCEGVTDKAEEGATNRQACVSAFMHAWEDEGKPDAGLPIVLIRDAVARMGFGLHEATVRRHLVGSGYRPRKGALGAGRTSWFHPDWRGE